MTQRKVIVDSHASLSFDGVDDRVDCGGDASLKISEEITVSLSIKCLSTGASVIIGNGEYNTSGYYLEKTAEGKLKFYEKNLYGGGSLESTNPVFVINRWVEIAVTYDKAFVRMYLNGVQIREDAKTASMVAGDANTFIGQYFAGSNFFKGKIKNARVFNRSLTATEIQNLHFNNIVPSGAVLNLDFENDTNATAYDKSGNGNHGTITGAVHSTDTPTKARKLIGGNLVENGDFERYSLASPQVATNTNVKFIDGTAGGSTELLYNWSISTKIGTASAVYDVGNGENGGNALKAVLTTATSFGLGVNQVPQNIPNKDHLRIGGAIRVKPNTEYTASYRFKINAQNSLKLTRRLYDINAVNLADERSVYQNTIGEWTTFQVTFTTGANAYWATIGFELHDISEVLFDYIHLTEV